MTALEGVKAICVGQFYFAPYCSLLMARLGADVNNHEHQLKIARRQQLSRSLRQRPQHLLRRIPSPNPLNRHHTRPIPNHPCSKTPTYSKIAYFSSFIL